MSPATINRQDPSSAGTFSGAYAFVDLAGFTALTEAHGDALAAAQVDRLCTLAQGRLVGATRLAKSIGDAVMLVGSDPLDLLASSVALLGDLLHEPAFPLPRAGATAGTAVLRGDDVIGSAVNIAARLAAHATGGQLLIDAALLPAADVLALPHRPLGPLALRNLTQPVLAHDVDVPGRPGLPVTDPVCRVRLDASQAVAVLREADTEYYFCSRRCLQLHLQGTGSPAHP